MSTDTVVVGCKLPNGVVLHITETPAGAKRPVIVAEQALRGFAIERKNGIVVPPSIVGNYGLTEVPRSFWDRWVKANKDWPPYKNGIIFAQPDQASAKANAIEMADDVQSGLEPLDPTKPARGVERMTKE